MGDEVVHESGLIWPWQVLCHLQGEHPVPWSLNERRQIFSQVGPAHESVRCSFNSFCTIEAKPMDTRHLLTKLPPIATLATAKVKHGAIDKQPSELFC